MSYVPAGRSELILCSGRKVNELNKAVNKVENSKKFEAFSVQFMFLKIKKYLFR